MASLLRLFGVQPVAYGVLLKSFWQLSLRVPTSLVSQHAGKTEGAIWKSWLIYAGFGLMVSIVAIGDPPREVFAALATGSAMFLIGLAVIADFAVFVMAPGDDEILFHQPIRSQTYLAARLSVAGLHVSILALCYGLLPALATLRWGEPAFSVLFLLSLVPAAWFCLLVAFGVYRIGLSLLGGARLDAWLTYLPALFSVLTFLIPQLLLGTLQDKTGAQIAPVLDYIPPAWFSAWPELLLGNFDPHILLRAGLAALILPLGMWFLVAALGRGLLGDLLQLVNEQGEQSEKRKLKPVLGSALAPKDPEAAAGYLLYVGAMRSRDSRMRTAPVLLMPIALLMLGLLQHVGKSSAIMGMMAVYALGAGAGTLVVTGAYHEDHRAAWFYGTVPMRRYGRFVAGFLRGLMLRHLLPVFAVVLLLALVRDPSWITLAGGIQAFVGGCISIPFLAGALKDPLFSRQFQHAEQLSQVGVYLLSMLLVAVFGIVHAAVVFLNPWAFLVTIPATFLLVRGWLRRALRRMDARPPWPVSSEGERS